MTENVQWTADPQPDGVYDLVVIGAGINGTGIARDAAARGLRVALVRAHDLADADVPELGRLVRRGRHDE